MTRTEAAILARLSPMPPLRPRWMAPREFASAAGGHHAVAAARMVLKGWVERQERGPGRYPRTQRPVWEYRITALGARALANHVALQAAFQARRANVNA